MMQQPVVISPKGQLTIPKKFREELDIDFGEKVNLTISNGKLIIEEYHELSPFKMRVAEYAKQYGNNNGSDINDALGNDNFRESDAW
jgi:AbrB family looped-hinge helix DNA binding protein